MEPHRPERVRARKEPYAWQRQTADRVAQENIILNVDTGMGKTLAAALAIDQALQREPLKKVAFVVCSSRPLARQQWRVIQEDCQEVRAEEVGLLTGYTTCSWKEAEWATCRERYRVLVGTAEIFRRAVLDKGDLHLNDISLLVVDECQNARGNSEMAQLLRHLHRDGRAQTRVMGLTASYAHGRFEHRSTLEKNRRELENLHCALLYMPEGLPVKESPCYHTIRVNVQGLEHGDLAERLCGGLWDKLEFGGVSERQIEKVVRSMALVLTELGREAFLYALRFGIVAQINGCIDNWAHMPEQARQEQARRLASQVNDLKASLEEAVQVAEVDEELGSLPMCSHKFLALRDLLATCFAKNREKPDYCGMVFVKEVSLAQPLAWLLNKELRHCSHFETLSSDGSNVELPPVVVATGTSSMAEPVRNAAIDAFADGLSKIMVNSACLEEGQDVAACAFIVRYSAFDTTKSHKQGTGRARQPRAEVFYFENDVEKELEHERLMDEVARDFSLDRSMSQLSSEAQNMVQTQKIILPKRHPFVIPETGVEVNFNNACKLLREYCSKVSHGAAKLESLFSSDPDGISLAVPGPNGGFKIDARELDVFFGDLSQSVPSSHVFSYAAILVLHVKGWLTPRNDPSKHVLQSTCWPARSPNELPSISLTQPGLFARFFLGVPLLVGATTERRLGTETSHRRHEDRLPTQQVLLGELRLPVQAIANTQSTVNRTFSNGGSVMHAMVALVQGKVQLSQFPPVRVACAPEYTDWAGNYFSADNRRIFCAKVVAPLMGIMEMSVQEINWTAEFPTKLRQQPRHGDTWLVSHESICEVREEVRRRAAMGDAAFEDENDFYPPLDMNSLKDEETWKDAQDILNDLLLVGVGCTQTVVTETARKHPLNAGGLQTVVTRVAPERPLLLDGAGTVPTEVAPERHLKRVGRYLFAPSTTATQVPFTTAESFNSSPDQVSDGAKRSKPGPGRSDARPSGAHARHHTSTVVEEVLRNLAGYDQIFDGSGHDWQGDRLQSRNDNVNVQAVSCATWHGRLCRKCRSFSIFRKYSNKKGAFYLLGPETCPGAGPTAWLPDYAIVLEDVLQSGRLSASTRIKRSQLQQFGFLGS